MEEIFEQTPFKMDKAMTSNLHPSFEKYRCWVFDCDGVLLNSNTIKTQAFHDVIMPLFGRNAADQLVAYHLEHGGISRFIKMQHLFTGILGREPKAGELDHVLDQFAQAVKSRLLNCEEAPRLRDVLEAVNANGSAFVVSGGMQDELRDIFQTRGLDTYFTAIFGSPDSKDKILARERQSGAMATPAVFIGDARYDFEVANQFNFDFVFASAWSEFSDWNAFFETKPVHIVSSLENLLVS